MPCRPGKFGGGLGPHKGGPHPAQARQEGLMPKVNGAQAPEGECRLWGEGEQGRRD